jgi:hypothetical protein
MVQSAVAYTAADLQMVDDHIIQGERHVTRQEELIARLRSHGLPSADAELLLDEFKATLAQHRAHRNIMLSELGGY